MSFLKIKKSVSWKGRKGVVDVPGDQKDLILPKQLPTLICQGL